MIGIREKERQGMEKTAPCMAIAERKGRRTGGGCMNVMSQFFQWNRIFSKERLFAKKLLLHAGEEQASKRFGKKAKTPKPAIHSITDGYTRGLKKREDDNRSDNNVNHKKNVEPQHCTRSPGLVARLMGLESMPTFAGPDKKSDEHVTRECKPPDDLRLSGSVEPKPDSLLQKPLQEIVPDRRSVKFAVGLHLKDVLSRPRHQNHHPKLPPQLKSRKGNTPHHSSSRTSRLVDVATRVLEHGVQAKNRAKYTLTQSDASQLPRSRLKANKTVYVASDSEKGSLMGKRLVGEQCIEYAASASNLVCDSSLHSPDRNEVKSVSTFIQRNKIRTQEQVSNSVRMRTIGGGTLGCSSSSQNKRASTPSRVSTLSTVCEAKDPIERRTCTRQDDSPAKRDRNEGRKSRYMNSGLKKNGNVKRVTVREEEEEETDRKLPPRNHQPSRRNKNVDASSLVSGDRTKETSKLSGEKLYRGKQVAMSGDALGALLDRTLKELTSEGEEETNGTGKAKRSTAMILQDLISALTTEQLVTKKESKPDTEFACQTRAENEESSLECAPGSCPCFEAHSLQPEADVRGSATSIKNNSDVSDYGAVTDLTERVNVLLLKMNEVGIGLKGRKLRHAQDVILNTELLFSDTTGAVPGYSLLDQLAVLGSRNWRPAHCLPGLEETNQFNRAFFFDSVIEFLDSRYSMRGHPGIRPFKNLPSHVNVESLFQEQTGRWMKLAGKPADDIVEWEMMNCSLGKWSDLDAQVFETGDEACSDILEGLLQELVIDLG